VNPSVLSNCGKGAEEAAPLLKKYSTAAKTRQVTNVTASLLALELVEDALDLLSQWLNIHLAHTVNNLSIQVEVMVANDVAHPHDAPPVGIRVLREQPTFCQLIDLLHALADSQQEFQM
jgi:hypothetical protein